MRYAPNARRTGGHGRTAAARYALCVAPGQLLLRSGLIPIRSTNDTKEEPLLRGLGVLLFSWLLTLLGPGPRGLKWLAKQLLSPWLGRRLLARLLWLFVSLLLGRRDERAVLPESLPRTLLRLLLGRLLRVPG